MTTDKDRQLSRQMAKNIVEYREKTGAGDLYHFAADVPFEETLYRGILTECAFAHEFGLAVNETVYQYGDGGADFLLLLRLDGSIGRYRIDVKSKPVRKSLKGLIDSITHLRVTPREIKPHTIYVLGFYLEPTDEACVLRWDLGKVLMEAKQMKSFENGNGEEAFTRQYEHCRAISELKTMVIKRSPIDPEDCNW